jgi:orotate phosphoribosyltransferase
MSAAATSNELLSLFLERKALLEGHFILSSGLHSDRYLQCALILQDPVIAERLGKALAAKFTSRPAAILSPAIGALIIGHEVARAMNARAIFAEKDETGKPVLRRGFSINPDEKVLVIEDVITTGLSTNEVVSLVEAADADLVGIGSIVNRGGTPDEKFTKWNTAVHSLLNIEVQSWTPGDCELCRQGKLPAVKPGSRKK